MLVAQLLVHPANGGENGCGHGGCWVFRSDKGVVSGVAGALRLSPSPRRWSVSWFPRNPNGDKRKAPATPDTTPCRYGWKGTFFLLSLLDAPI
ncbi:hypothetical protein [Reticulibacter mediterranei]|uniref:hypothetical protein n=1 Tax=Reticulibacter mediterranei TaxID=2778369 RepID=UPI001C68A2F1|nr:hypothetical protein [Reticulibacter mediterranei]